MFDDPCKLIGWPTSFFFIFFSFQTYLFPTKYYPIIIFIVWCISLRSSLGTVILGTMPFICPSVVSVHLFRARLWIVSNRLDQIQTECGSLTLGSTEVWSHLELNDNWSWHSWGLAHWHCDCCTYMIYRQVCYHCLRRCDLICSRPIDHWALLR